MVPRWTNQWSLLGCCCSLVVVAGLTTTTTIISTTKTPTFVVSAYQSGIPQNVRYNVNKNDMNGVVGAEVQGSKSFSVGSTTDESGANKDGVMDQYEAAFRASVAAAAPSERQRQQQHHQRQQQGGESYGDFSSVTPAFSSSSIQPQRQQSYSAPRPSYGIPRSIDTMLEEIESELQAVEEQLKLQGPPSTIQDIMADTTYSLKSFLMNAQKWWYSDEGLKTRQNLSETTRRILLQSVSATREIICAVQDTWEEEGGDGSKISQKAIVSMQHSVRQVIVALHDLPTTMTVKAKETVQSDEFKKLPKHTLDVVHGFLVSEQVQQLRRAASEAFLRTLESDNMIELRQRRNSNIQETYQNRKFK